MDAEFNYGDYSEPLMPGERSQRGPNWNLNLKQFLTKYPLSMDNSFLGFALKSQRNETIRGKKFMAYVHGDTAREFKAHKLYLKAIYKHMRIHTAVPAEGLQKDLPFIVNHGNINLTVIKELLRKSKLFTGLGSPFEEALALEAVAQGCIFINPKFSYPKNRLNSKALKEVSSSRTLSSQHPYLEAFVGKPLVYTVDIWNKTEVIRTLKDVLKTQAKPFVPFEFSCEGMLERLNAYIENQNFCDKSYHWPVQTRELKISMARPGSSCTEACFKEGLTCEPAYFHVLNSSKIPNCAEAVSEESIVAPAIEEDTSRCVLQQNTLLFSCAGQHFNYKRVCPCRPYRQGQIALCKNCF